MNVHKAIVLEEKGKLLTIFVCKAIPRYAVFYYLNGIKIMSSLDNSPIIRLFNDQLSGFLLLGIWEGFTTYYRLTLNSLSCVSLSSSNYRHTLLPLAS